jgi:PAS domain S-box-containing protein
MVQGREQGVSAARMALDVLAGMSPAAMDVVRDSLTRDILDHDVLVRFGFQDKPLAPGTMVVGTSATDFSFSRDVVWGTVFLAGFTGLLLLFLLYSFRAKRRAERFLRERLDFLQTLMNTIPVPVFFVDRAGVYQRCNAEFAELVGRQAREIVGASVHDLFPPAAAAAIEERDADLRSGGSQSYELKLNLGERGLRHYICNKATIVGGNLSGIVGVMLDVTEMKRTQDELAGKTRQLEAIFQALPDLYFRFDAEGTILDYKPLPEDKRFMKHDDLVGRPIRSVLPREVGARWHENVRKTLRYQSVTVVEYELPFEQGPRNFEARFAPIDEDNVVTFVRDITVQQKAKEQLAQEKRRLSVTLQSIGDGVVTTDTLGRVVLLNRVAEDLTGWTQVEAYGRRLGEVFRIYDAKTKIPRDCPAQRVLREGRTQTLKPHTLLISREGRERVVADTAAPIRDQSENMLGVVLVFRDVTEKQKLEQEALKTAKLESLGMLAGGIAHDFNNFLTAVLSNISMAREYAQNNKVMRRLGKAEAAGRQAQNLTRQLLTFSKGGAPIKELTAVPGIIYETARFTARGSNVRLDYDIPDELWAVEADPGQMSQVINNLILNADQAQPDGGATQVEARNVAVGEQDSLPLEPGRYVRIRVTDRGPGIPERHVKRIFDPYYSTKEGGTGMGLAVCHSIVRRHGGFIDVDSELGRGTTFSVYLPASDQTSAAGPVQNRHMVAGKGRVLFMDDEENVREVVEDALTYLGYEVDFAVDGDEAVGKYKSAMQQGDPFDVVVMDLIIPGGKGGKQAVRDLLRIDPQAKVIVSSGYSRDPIMSRYREHGFVGVAAKPYSMEELSELLSRVMDEAPDAADTPWPDRPPEVQED